MSEFSETRTIQWTYDFCCGHFGRDSAGGDGKGRVNAKDLEADGWIIARPQASP